MKTVIGMLFLLFTMPLLALPIDLTEYDIYVRKGFKKEWIHNLPPQVNSKWKVVPRKKGFRPVRISEMNFKDIPKFSYLKSNKNKPETFTLISSFNLTKKQLNEGPLGIYLAQIGMNWEVYLNGILVKSEMHLSKDRKKILVERAVRGEILEIKYPMLKVGSNIIAYRIIGNPLDDRTGMLPGNPYTIDVHKKLVSKYDQHLILMLLAVYLSFGIYHLFLFVAKRTEYFNLYHGLASIIIFAYMLCRTTIIFVAVNDTLILKYIELVSLFLMLPFSMFFIDNIIREKITFFSKIYFVFCLFLIIILPYNKTTALRIWQYSSFLPIIHMMFYNILIFFVKNVAYRFQNKYTKGHVIIKLAKSMGRSLLVSIPGNLLIGIIITSISAAMDIIDSTSGIPVNYTVFGIFFLFFGTVLILANRFIRVHNAMEELNVSLEQRIIERTSELSTANLELEEMNEQLTETRDALWSEMSIAKKIQTVLLPEKPVLNDFEISVHMDPADEVGGDYYDVINIAGKDWIVIGDVSGHGVPAGLIMMMAQTSIHTAIDQNPDLSPSELLTIINRTLTQNIKQLNEDKYMTITVLAALGKGRFQFSGLHQDIMIFRRATEKVELVETDGMWVGMIDDIDDMLSNSSLKLDPGDTMLLYTDGITEARKKDSVKDNRDVENDMFGDNKLKDLFQVLGNKSTDDIKNGIMKELENDYICNDDVTMVVLKSLE